MSASRRQDRERKKRQKQRRQRAVEGKRVWSVPRLEGGQDPTHWPVERAWTPMLDAWNATGTGTAAILRRRPDGLFAGAFFSICMTDDGLTYAGTQLDGKPGEFESLLDKVVDQIPPSEPGPPDIAAAFAWGAYALSVESGNDWQSVPGVKEALALMDKPPGSPGQWADALWDGSIPAGLRRILRNSPLREDLPEDKEIMVLTTATFEAQDTGAIAAGLRRARPDFNDDGSEGGVHHFVLTRPYPKKHWSPLSLLGGRQVVGRVEVHHDANEPRVVVEAKTLSMTCLLIQRLKRIVGDAVRLKDTRWMDSQELIRRARAEAGNESDDE